MKRILISHSYFLRFDPKQWNIMQPYAPLGTLYAAAVLRKAGYEVKLWDPMFAASPDELIPVMQSFNPDALVIYDDGFNYLTKMCLTNMRDAAFRMIQLAGQKNVPSFISSSDASDHFEKYLATGACAVIRGEGEITLIETLDAWFLHGMNQFNSIDGIAYNETGGVAVNKTREVLRQLDEIPFPAWDLADMNQYKQRWIDRHGYFSVNMSTTRGCPYKCNWCAKPIYGNRYNSRSPENVVQEIRFLIEKYQPGHIWFCDDIFGLKPGWVNLFAEQIAANMIPIRYKIQSRVDLLLQENNIAALAASGCDTVWLGAESGSQKILDAMDKGTKVEQISEATRLLKKYRIKPAFFLQFGYPGETMEDIDKTIAMVEELLPDDIGVSVSYPLPGTIFYEHVREQLQPKANWTHSDELALMFNNTFPPAFYRHLHRYVHKRYRIKQGISEFKMPGSNAFLIQLRRLAAIPYHLPGSIYHGWKMKSIAGIKSGTTESNPPDPGSEDPSAFDKVAEGYDSEFTHTTTGRLQRGNVFKYLGRHLDPSIHPRVIEINGGTGEDAAWFARKGFSITHTDGSVAMVKIAKQKFADAGLSPVPDSRVMPFSRIHELSGGSYDIVFSNFGGLNCIGPESLKQTFRMAHDCLRQGGRFIAVVMGRKCLIEKMYFLMKNDRLASRRRLHKNPVTANVGGESVNVWYYSPGEIRALAEPGFQMNRVIPIGLFIPPSYLEKHFTGKKYLSAIALGAEQLFSGIPSLSDYADHYLIEFTRP